MVFYAGATRPQGVGFKSSSWSTVKELAVYSLRYTAHGYVFFKKNISTRSESAPVNPSCNFSDLIQGAADEALDFL